MDREPKIYQRIGKKVFFFSNVKTEYNTNLFTCKAFLDHELQDRVIFTSKKQQFGILKTPISVACNFSVNLSIDIFINYMHLNFTFMI